MDKTNELGKKWEQVIKDFIAYAQFTSAIKQFTPDLYEEVKGIADEDVAKGIKGQDPVATGQLTREQIAEAEANPKKRLKMAAPKHKMPNVRQKRAPRYTPAAAFSAATLSVRSHVNSGSSRPKWP